jgi:hypothetical protein
VLPQFAVRHLQELEGLRRARRDSNPNLLIRRSRRIVQDRPLRSLRWANIPQPSTRDHRYPAAWQQYWQQSRWTSLNRSPGHPAGALGRLPWRPIAEIPTGFNHLRPTLPGCLPTEPCCLVRFSIPAKTVPEAILPWGDR